MPTVIDSLVVKLGLDTSGVKKGRAETDSDLRSVSNSAHRTAADLQSSGRGAAEFFGAMHREALGLIGTLIGATGLEQVVRRSTESMASLGREAANLNVDPQKLAAFSMALERFGASGESTRQTLFGISQAVERFKLLGDPGILKYLQVIGAGPQNSSFEILQRFIAYAQAHKKDAAQVNLVGRGLGIDQSTINAALQLKSAAEFQKAYNEALRDAPTAKQVEEAQKLQTAWTALEQAAVGLANKMVTQLSPAMESVAHWGTEIIHQHPELVETITGIATGIGVLGGLRLSAKALGLTGVAEAFGAILSSIDGVLVTLGISELIYKATQIKGLNEGERAWLDKWRSAHGLPTGQSGIPLEQYKKDHPGAVIPNGTGPISPGIAPPKDAERRSNMEQTRQFWLSKGFTPDQVAGILAGGPGAESGFDPNVTGDNGSSYGLYQEHNERMRAMFAKYGPHPTVEQQNQFAWDELNDPQNSNLLRSLRATKGGADTARLWTKGFERPMHPDAEAERRAAAVSQFQQAMLPAARHAPSVHAAAHNSTTTHETHVTGPITIHTKATDAHGIARGFADALTVQANRGLQ